MGFLDPNSWANALSDDPTGSKAAANTQAQWQNRAIDLQEKEWNTQQANQAPWLSAGTQAVNQLASGTAPGGQFSTVPTFQFDSSQIQTDPGYAWRTQQGNNAITAAGAAAGNLGSGNLGTALVDYGQNAASQEYQNAFNRSYQQQLDQYNSKLGAQNTLYNRLAGVSGTGQTSANQLMSGGMANANNIANQMSQIGTNYGNAAINNRLATNQAYGNLSNQLSQGVGNWAAANWYGNSGQYGTLYSNDMSLDNASMSDSNSLWGSVSNWFSS